MRATAHIVGHDILDYPGGVTRTLPRALTVMIVMVISGFDDRSSETLETAREAKALCERHNATIPGRLFGLYVPRIA